MFCARCFLVEFRISVGRLFSLPQCELDEFDINQPDGFAQAGANGELLFCKLQKLLYGLKQTGRERNKTLTIGRALLPFLLQWDQWFRTFCTCLSPRRFVLCKQRQNAAWFQSETQGCIQHR